MIDFFWFVSSADGRLRVVWWRVGQSSECGHDRVLLTEDPLQCGVDGIKPAVNGQRRRLRFSQPENAGTQPVWVDIERGENLHGHALTLAYNSEEQVLRADGPIAELERLTQRKLEHLLRSRGEGKLREISGRRTTPDHPRDLGTTCISRDPELGQCRGRDALALGEQAKQQVLRAEIIVVEGARLLLCQGNAAAGSLIKAFQHRTSIAAAARLCARIPARR